MSFDVREPVGPRAAVARSIREGDHHAKGKHTLLDRSREFAAELVEHVGTPDGLVGCRIAGSHSTDADGVITHASVSVYASVALPDAAPEGKHAVPETETQIEAQHDAAFAANGKDGEVLGG